jgi:hypothetical protein
MRARRGTALPETALVIGVSLLVILGAAQMTLIGYSQVGADGAAFVAAHSVAVNPSANGTTTATSVFGQFAAANFTTPSPVPNVIQSQVSKNVGGFTLLAGGRATFNVRGADREYSPAQTSSTPSPFNFGVTATLLNDCDPTGNCTLPSSTSIYLAQAVGTGHGNGVNGLFAEWQCHQKYFASLNWPATRPQNYIAIKGGNFDVKTQGSTEQNIYSWDKGANNCS